MTRTVIQFIWLFLVMVLTQAVCSKICLFNVAVPIVFIYYIMRLPVNLGRNWSMTIAFAMGLTVDIMNNTAGMNALCSVIIAALRHPVLSLFVIREEEIADTIPSMKSLGAPAYLKYMCTLTTTYCLLLFAIQAFSLHQLPLTLARIAASSLLSIVLILGFDSIATTDREKRL